MSLTKKFCEIILIPTILTSFAFPTFAKDNINYYIGFAQNTRSILQGEEITVAILHKTGWGFGRTLGELRYSESDTKESSDPYIDRIELGLRARALKEGWSILYNPQDNDINFAAQAGMFKLRGEVLGTAKAYGAPPFQDQVQTEEQKESFSGEGREAGVGLSVGSRNFRIKALINYIELRLKYNNKTSEDTPLQGITGKIGFDYSF